MTSGVVRSFDEHRGLGTVADDAGNTWPFHCTAIADGSRNIAVGATVTFSLVPGHLGRMEARAMRAMRAVRCEEAEGTA